MVGCDSVPVGDKVSGKSCDSLSLVYKRFNHVKCAWCKEKIELNLDKRLYGKDEAAHAKVSFDNCRSHFQTHHPECDLLLSTKLPCLQLFTYCISIIN